MALNVIWYLLFIGIIAAYVVLDGFDLGVGIVHLFVPRDDRERRISLNSVGLVWDGNEVWLVVGGGVLFAGFPEVYATLFSGFYPAFMLVLAFLILRAVSIEFRSKRPSAAWRGFWDWVFGLASLLLALLLGLTFGNIAPGVPIDAAHNISFNPLDLIHPYALLVGRDPRRAGHQPPAGRLHRSCPAHGHRDLLLCPTPGQHLPPDLAADHS